MGIYLSFILIFISINSPGQLIIKGLRTLWTSVTPFNICNIHRITGLKPMFLVRIEEMFNVEQNFLVLCFHRTRILKFI